MRTLFLIDDITYSLLKFLYFAQCRLHRVPSALFHMTELRRRQKTFVLHLKYSLGQSVRTADAFRITIEKNINFYLNFDDFIEGEVKFI
jgi:hypothetical protein